MRKFSILFFLLSIFYYAGVSQEINKNIIGYFTSWSVYGRDYHVPDIPPEQINAINYAFANISGGEIVLGDYYADVDKFYEGDSWEPGSLRGSFHRLQLMKEAHPHIRTLISVGGWTWSTYFSDVALTEESREAFAASCVSFIEQYGFDGVDIDWEYPVEGGHSGNVYRPEDKENFTLLLQELRAQLDEAGDYLLTIAAPASPMKMENMEISDFHQFLDWINIMTYDYHGPWAGDGDPVTNFNAPLNMVESSPLEEPFKSSFNVSATVQAYLDEGVPREKLNVGLAFYGRGYANVAGSDNGLYQSYNSAPTGTWEAGVFDYWDLVENYIGLDGHEFYYHEEARVPWLYNASGNVMISYDNVQSIGEKCDYIMENSLGGAMFWEFSGDKYNHLLNEVFEVLSDTSSNEISNIDLLRLSNNESSIDAYPNPFNPVTTINMYLEEPGKITLSIYNIKGRFVSTLVDGYLDKGHHYITWDGNSGEAPVAAGIYYAILELKDKKLGKKLLLIK